MATYSQWTTLGLRPRVTPQALLQAHIEFWAFLTLTSTSSFQVIRESSVPPRYLTNMERCKVCPNKRGSKNPGSFLFLVNETSPVLLETTDRARHTRVQRYERPTVWAVTPYLGIFSPLEDKCHSHIPVHKHFPHWALITIHLQPGTIGGVKYPSLWAAPGHRDTPGESPESCHGQPTLQGGSNPSYDGEIYPMSS